MTQAARITSPSTTEAERVMALSEFPQSCSSEFLGLRGKVSAGWCRW